METNKQSIVELLAKSEISLHLDTYDDIFSDFDPRPYHQRAISVDLIDETRRAIRDKTDGQLTLRFLAPAKLRNTHHEHLIKRRLHEHFSKHHLLLAQEKRALVRNGALVTLLGFSMAGIATVLYPYEHSKLATFFIVLLEPGGWFTLWHGLDMAIFDAKQKTLEIEYYKKMSTVEIIFEGY